MSKTNVEKQLESIQVPVINVSKYESQLENVLMDSSHWNKKTSFFNFFLKGGEENIKMKRFIASGTIVAVMIMATLFFVFSPLNKVNTQMAYAEQLTQASSQAVSNLTPSQLQALKQKLPEDPDEILQEAKSAKDLQILTYDQFMSEYGNLRMGTGGMTISANGSITPPVLPSISGAPMPKSESLDLHNLKFLQFTDTNGDKVVLGIDQSNLPVFVFGKGPDGSTFGVVRDSGKPPIGKGQVQVAVSLNGNGSGPVIMVNGKK